MSITLEHTDKIGSLLLLALSVVIFIVTADFPAGPGETGPDFYPRVIAVLIAFFALVQLGYSVTRGEQLSHEISLEVTIRVVGALVLVVAYVVLLPRLGFIVATILFLAVAMRYSGVTTYGRMVVVSVGLTVLLYYTFAVFLRVPLPDAEWEPVAEIIPTIVPWDAVTTLSWAVVQSVTWGGI